MCIVFYFCYFCIWAFFWILFVGLVFCGKGGEGRGDRAGRSAVRSASVARPPSRGFA